MVMIMKKRYNKAQKNVLEYLESKFLVRNYVSALDLAIIQNPEDFPKNKGKDKHYNRGVEHAKKDLAMLGFFFVQMKPRYRLKIMQSTEFKNFINDFLDVGVGKFHYLTREEDEQSTAFYLQMLGICLLKLSRLMPEEFIKAFNNSAQPLSDLIHGIYEFQRKNNMKTIPKFETIALPIA